MQMVIQVFSTGKRSLREAIVNDDRLEKFKLRVSEEKRKGRKPGWAKIHGEGQNVHGVINLEWVSQARMLLCRVVTKQRGRPNTIVGRFMRYLFTRFASRLELINIMRR